MRTPLESEFKSKLCHALRRAGCYVYRTVTGGSGTVGTPDLLVCCRGRFVGVEVKRDERSKPSQPQLRRLEEIRAAGGVAMVVHPGNVGELMEVLDGS